MSALPVPPLYEEPPKPPVRRAQWKRILGWTAVGIGILIVLIVVAVFVLLHNESFHRYVLHKAQEKATAALGSQVQARDFNLTWSGMSPTLEMYNIVIHGAAPYPDPPLLQVDHLKLGLTITSLLKKTWYVSEAIVDHPVVHVFVDRKGIDNLPQTKSSGQKSNTSIFDLGVRHALLNNGEAYYNNRKSILNADLHAVNFQAGFDPAKTMYAGTLSYRNGHLQMENWNPMPHDLDAKFSLTPQVFTLDSAVLRSGASQFALKATVENLAQPKATATYEATIDAGESRRIMKNSTLPEGVIRANGSLQFASQPNRPLMDTLTLNGAISSRVLAVRTPSFRGQITNIGARYSLANGNVVVQDLRAHLLGGELTGTLTMRNITGASKSHLTAALRGVSLADLKSMMNSPGLRQVALNGAINAQADATWGKTFDDLIARTDATIQAHMSPANGATAVPLNGVIHARYTAPAKQITLTQSYIRTPQTSLTLDGTVSNRSALAVRLQANDLHELETVASMFRAPAAGQPATPLGLYGTATFTGAVRGSTSAPEINGELSASNLRVRGTSWRLLRTNVDLSPSLASLQNGELDPATRGKITFNVRAGLHQWSFLESSPVDFKLNASQVNIADLAKAAGTQVPVVGTLAADVSVNGTQLNPVGQGRVSLTQAKVGVERVQSVNLNFQGTGDQVNAKLDVKLPAGAANATLTYLPKQQGYEAQLQATGIQLAQLQTIKDKNLQLTGVLNLVASGRGTLNNPGLEATAEIPRLDIHNQTISGLKLQAAVANHVANVALDSNVVNTSVRARGTVHLTGDYEANATFDTQAIPFAPLVAAYAPSQAGSVTGQAEIHGTLRGPLKDKSRLDAHLVIPQLSVNYKNTVQLAEASPIRIDFANGVLQLQRSAIRGTGTDLQFQGTVPVASSAPMSLLLLGTVDLRLAQLLNPDIASSGQVRFDINSYGQRANPDVQGRVEIVNANFATGDLPIGVQNGNGVLTLTKDRLNVTQFQGTVGGGTLSASGGIIYRPAIQFDLALKANGVRLLYPDGVRTGLDTNLALMGTTESALLRGQVRIDQLQFVPGFDLMDFMGQFGGGAATPPPSQGLSQNLRLDIGVQSTSGINLVSRTLSIQGAANLRVSGTAAQPVILGRVNLSGGDLIFSGNRYLLQGGTIDFVNPVQTEPVVNVSVNTTIQQYNIQLRFWGPADHLHTNYASDPALPPSDIINLIAFGKTSEATAANPTPPGNLGAESLIASQVSSQITSRVEKIAGISQLSVDPELGSNTKNPGARVAIQQRVTSKIFVTFATDVTSTQRQVIKLEYQASPRLSFSGVRDENGGFGFDTKIRKTW